MHQNIQAPSFACFQSSRKNKSPAFAAMCSTFCAGLHVYIACQCEFCAIVQARGSRTGQRGQVSRHGRRRRSTIPDLLMGWVLQASATGSGCSSACVSQPDEQGGHQTLKTRRPFLSMSSLRLSFLASGEGWPPGAAGDDGAQGPKLCWRRTQQRRHRRQQRVPLLQQDSAKQRADERAQGQHTEQRSLRLPKTLKLPRTLKLGAVCV